MSLHEVGWRWSNESMDMVHRCNICGHVRYRHGLASREMANERDTYKRAGACHKAGQRRLRLGLSEKPRSYNPRVVAHITVSAAA
jgi:hypothetical protein